MADPNWLLSAAAQSSAAVVAVVAGFITARLLGLSSEKAGLSSALRDRRAHHASLRGEFRQAEVAFERYRINEFLDSQLDYLRGCESLPGPDEMLGKHEGEPFNRELFEAHYTALSGKIGDARKWVIAQGERIEAGDALTFEEWASASEISLPEALDHEEVEYAFDAERSRLLRVRQDQQEEARRRALGPLASIMDGINLPLMSPTVSDARRDWEIYRAHRQATRYDELRGRSEVLGNETWRAVRELEEAESKLNSFRYPPRWWIPLVILLYLIAVGVALPLFLMPAETLDPLLRWGINLGIVGGLGALVAYLWVEFMKLKT